MPGRYLNLDQLINLSLDQESQGLSPNRNLLDSVSDGIFAVDRDMRIISFNSAIETMTGYSRDEVIGQTCHDIFNSEICQQDCLIHKAICAGEKVDNLELAIYDRQNRPLRVSISASPIRNERGEIVGAVESLRNLATPMVQTRQSQESFFFEGIYSRNAGMHGLFDVLPDIAASTATVLIVGESGTGKELFAQAVHNLSPRSDGPLVVINCGALPEPLLEAEIFGVRRGAYTGAVESRPGRLEMAQGGTLFLDEIGDLPLALQVKLLRVLENREYQPLGAKSPVHADVRFVAATHRNLKEMVDAGNFRRDLYFRLNVVGFTIPPLRDRSEDIPLLLDMALERLNRDYGKAVRGFSRGAMRLLVGHDYPGNVRELLNIVEHAIIFCRNGEISTELLPENFRNPEHENLKRRRGCPEKEELCSVLERFNGNRNRAAQEFGVDRTTLWRWMSRCGLA
ncbi:sigma-54 interaction domain-containing protein [Geopsychrobacter electrodiphilus]|uniref:sigma-54 interaction domain-containing protein n=1 Tax=Geopsychrobacter electrodiphilus TaxID=225196 RepID=UPI0003767B32|nr:sigma 54-interacting transcriptional regulator [Geopsychrobacter electrodiphilus]